MSSEALTQQKNSSESLPNSVQSTSNSSQMPPMPAPLEKLQKNYYSEAYLKKPSIFQKILTKIENKESNFQIFRPKGDLQLPIDGEQQEKLTKEEEKYKMYYKMIKPLKGVCIYSPATLQMKLEMDLLINEYFNSCDEDDDDNENL